MKRVTPKVFLVGESAVNHVGMNDYLSHVGAPEWTSDAPSDSERLMEFMGRLCYRSWKPGMNANVTKVREGNAAYLGNILNVKHGSVLEHPVTHWVFADVSRVFCFHPSTEILTAGGWKSIEAVLDGELILTKDPSTGKARWSRNLQLHRFWYTGQMYQVESSQWRSPAVTPEHTMWCAKYDLRRCRDLSCHEIADRFMEKVEARDVFGKRIVVSHDIVLDGGVCEKVEIGDHMYDAEDFYEWLGWLASDGSISKDRNSLQIVQSKAHNLPRIRLLMDRLFGERWKFYECAQPTFRITDVNLIDWVIKKIGRKKSERNLVSLIDLNRNLLRRFIDGFVLGDGSVNDGHIVVYCGYSVLAKSLQAILAACGFSSNVRVVSRIGQTHQLGDQKLSWGRDEYVVSFHKKAESLVRVDHWMSFSYEGFVYCPRTVDGLVFVRNQGMAAWFGNTHELVRHRAGVAISQESLRFVRLTDLGLWLPPEVDADPVLKELFETTFEHLEDVQRKMVEHLKLDEGMQFKEKKVLTSLMRRAAPIGLATTIGFSMNFRTLRHIVAMRSAGSAEVEIRMVMDQMMAIAAHRWPNVLGDFSRNAKGEWVPKNEKV